MTCEKRMEGKKVLVTGAGTGIGREVALEFCRQGADTVFHYSSSRDGAIAGVDQARSEGAKKATALHSDFRQPDAATQLAEEAIDFLGGIDVLINNASISMNREFERVTPEQFDTLFNVNIRSMYFVTQATVKTMLEQGSGVVINTSSIHAYEGCRDHTVYSATKGAISAFTRVLAIEMAPRGIRVNGIAPGAVEVPAHHEIFPDYDRDAFGRMIPAGFVGQPLDIARVAVFLASDDARYIVGQMLIVDGGTTSWMPFSDGFRQQIAGQFGKNYVPGL